MSPGAAGPLIDDARFREKIARLEIQLLSHEWSLMRVISLEQAGHEVGTEASMLKIRGSEIQQDLGELLMECAGPYALPYAPGALERGQEDDDAWWHRAGRPRGPVSRPAQGVDLRRYERGAEEPHRARGRGPVSMDFNYTDEQTMLADAVGRWLASDYDFATRRRLAAGEIGWETNWQQLADLGLLGINVPENLGGMGGSPVEALIVMQAFGRVLVVEPYLQTAIVSAPLIARVGTEAQREQWLPAIVAGGAPGRGRDA